jgi:hypothetical protein
VPLSIRIRMLVSVRKQMFILSHARSRNWLDRETRKEANRMQSCTHFETCSSNLCPRDPDISFRTWYIGEDVCPLREYRDLPFIRRQRQINKRRPPSLIDKLFTYAELVETAPKKRTLSPEAKARLRELGKRHQFGKKCLPECREILPETVG